MQQLVGPGEGYFTAPLLDLGAQTPQFAGIFMPAAQMGQATAGITSQFLEEAEVYHHKYTSTARSLEREREFVALLARHGVQTGRPLSILDIGAGSGGNTFAPLARLFPGSDYVATDLSPNLLCVCTDAAQAPLRSGAFDLVVGSSILHHLVAPEAVLQCAHDVLRPGGVALFFEPFESGHAIVASAFRQIRRIASLRGDLDASAAKVLDDMLCDWDARAGDDKSAPHFALMDDKWLFTESWLRRSCRKAGFDGPAFLARQPTADRFSRFVETLLHLHSGLPRAALPLWAWEIVAEADSAFSTDFAQELRLEDWFTAQRP